MNLDAEMYLAQQPMWSSKKNTLSQLRDLLAELGHPDRSFKIIHVAGSNGKGSVCSDLTAILMAGGYRVGTFVSPHLVDLRERCLLDGNMAGRHMFQDAFERVYRMVDQMTGRGYCRPLYFEYIFLVALTVFAEWKPDYIILETGLGGTLDTTNVIERPAACVITSISLEHTRYLGDTIEAIAGQKAGIIKPGVPVIYDDNRSAASAVIRQAAEMAGSAAYPVSEQDSYREASFAAPYQAMNAALAVKTIEVLGIPGITREHCRKALGQVRWPGRMEPAGPDIWLDGAHNPGGIAAFIRAVQVMQEGNSRNIQILFAAVNDKDYNEMIRMLCQELKPERVTIARVGSSRGQESDILADVFKQFGCIKTEAYPDTVQALDAALRNKTVKDRLYVVGSLYLIGEIKELIRRKMNAELRGGDQPL